MFSTPIWKEWLETVQLYKDRVINTAPYKVETEFAAGQVRGSVEILDMVLNLEAAMAQSADELEENTEE
jgi:hypothetical protein